MPKSLWVRPIAAVAIALLTAMPIVACTSSTATTDSTGQYIDDASITTKVKSELLGDSGLKSFDISVTTLKDVVHLSGTVSSEQLRARATNVAAGVAGVRAVENNIVVK
jgi:osmotically-inducible protein OsmY